MKTKKKYRSHIREAKRHVRKIALGLVDQTDAQKASVELQVAVAAEKLRIRAAAEAATKKTETVSI